MAPRLSPSATLMYRQHSDSHPNSRSSSTPSLDLSNHQTTNPSPPRILISDSLSPIALEIFAQRGIIADLRTGLTRSELLNVIKGYDGLAVRSSTQADSQLIKSAGPSLKVIGRAGIGIDNIDINSATSSGILVMNTPFGNSITTAEHTIAMMFALARQIPKADISTQSGKWEKNAFMGVELFGKVLGLIGCGNIGSIVADRAIALKMKVLAFDPFLSKDRSIALGIEKVDSLDSLISRSNFISLHTPLNDKTRNILSHERLSKTRPGTFIINCARGGLVDESALRTFLDSGHLGGAGFDVFAIEPARSSILFGAKNFIATPHLGAATLEAQENCAIQIADQISSFLLTGAVTNALNSPSVTADEAPKLRPFIGLSELLGSFAGQMVDSLASIEITYVGEVSKLNVKPMTSAGLAGVLRPVLAHINMVSAPAVAKARGITVKESTKEISEVYDSMIRITVRTPKGEERSFAGSVLAGEARVVEIYGMGLEAPISQHMLYINNVDRPGFIGSLGTLLGKANVNIATFNLGRMRSSDQAVALVGIDSPPGQEVVEELNRLPHVKEVRVLAF